MASDVPGTLLPPTPTPSLSPAERGRAALSARNFASFWRRLVAAILDAFLLGVVSSAAAEAFTQMSLPPLPFVEVMYAVGFVAYGGTPGMRALSVRVVDSEGSAPGIKRSLIRYVIPALSWVPLLIFFASPWWFLDHGVAILIVLGSAIFAVGLLDPLWMIWDPDKQTLHDELASTYVVNDR